MVVQSGGLINAERSRFRVTEVRAAGPDKNRVSAFAQLYGMENDRDEVFVQGAFAQSIRDRVPAGRVKITDSHMSTGEATHGKVLSAEETSVGLKFEALWSAAATSQDIKTKMLEGILDEWSIEFRALQADLQLVGEADGTDSYYRRVIRTALWRGLSIVPYSSQGCDTTLEVRHALPLVASLPILARGAATPAEAREALIKWSRNEGRAEAINYAMLERGFLACRERNPDGTGYVGQFAEVVDGRLVVTPSSLARAAEELLQFRAEIGPEALGAGMLHLDHYLGLAAQRGMKVCAPWERRSEEIATDVQVAAPVQTTTDPGTVVPPVAVDGASIEVPATPAEPAAPLTPPAVPATDSSTAIESDAPAGTDGNAAPPTADSNDAKNEEQVSEAEKRKRLQLLDLDLSIEALTT